MALAKVYYQEKPEGLLILKLVNFLSLDEIAERHGEEVKELYINGSVMYRRNKNRVFIKRPDGMKHYDVGMFLSPERFSKMISDMKICGKALNDVVQEHRVAKALKETFKIIEI